MWFLPKNPNHIHLHHFSSPTPKLTPLHKHSQNDTLPSPNRFPASILHLPTSILRSSLSNLRKILSNSFLAYSVHCSLSSTLNSSAFLFFRRPATMRKVGDVFLLVLQVIYLCNYIFLTLPPLLIFWLAYKFEWLFHWRPKTRLGELPLTQFLSFSASLEWK